MDTQERFDELLAFFKALADANRLKIVGLLAQGEHSVEELAAMLSLGASTVSHHLARLSEAGLVSARPDSYYNVYRLETGTLETMSQRLLSQEQISAVAVDVDLKAYDRKVVENYSGPDGRLKQLPSQRKKLDAVLRYVVRDFEKGRTYSEREVNDILRRYNDDTARLRRELFEQGYIDRDRSGREYWLVTYRPGA
jgi:predicted transcriptional regulator